MYNQGMRRLISRDEKESQATRVRMENTGVPGHGEDLEEGPSGRFH